MEFKRLHQNGNIVWAAEILYVFLDYNKITQVKDTKRKIFLG